MPIVGLDQCRGVARACGAECPLTVDGGDGRVVLDRIAGHEIRLVGEAEQLTGQPPRSGNGIVDGDIYALLVEASQVLVIDEGVVQGACRGIARHQATQRIAGDGIEDITAIQRGDGLNNSDRVAKVQLVVVNRRRKALNDLRCQDKAKGLGAPLFGLDVGVAAKKVVALEIGRRKGVYRTHRRRPEPRALRRIARSEHAGVARIAWGQAGDGDEVVVGQRGFGRGEFAEVGGSDYSLDRAADAQVVINRPGKAVLARIVRSEQRILGIPIGIFDVEVLDQRQVLYDRDQRLAVEFVGGDGPVVSGQRTFQVGVAVEQRRVLTDGRCLSAVFIAKSKADRTGGEGKQVPEVSADIAGNHGLVAGALVTLKGGAQGAEAGRVRSEDVDAVCKGGEVVLTAGVGH